MAEIKVIKTSIDGLIVIEPEVFDDNRGSFIETYNKESFKKAGLEMTFAQDNESTSKKGVLRGLHFQTKFQQGKLVRVISGTVYDVGIDLRKNSKTYGKYEGIILSKENKKMFYLPEGFAHGFLVLSSEAIFSYKCTNAYHPEYDAGIIYNDPDVGIKWPLEDVDIILSEKDRNLPMLKNTKYEL